MYNDSLEEAKITGKARERLDDLIALYIAATDPEADYYYDGDVPDHEKILKDIEKEFGSKIAKDVGNGTNIFHYGKDNNQGALLTYGDPTKHRGARRLTKSGKINKQDAAALKKDIRDILKNTKLNTAYRSYKLKGKLPESDAPEADKKETEKQQLYDVLPKYVLYKDQDRMKVMKGKIVKQWIDDRGKLVFKTSGGTTVYADAAEEIIESKLLGFKTFIKEYRPGVSVKMPPYMKQAVLTYNNDKITDGPSLMKGSKIVKRAKSYLGGNSELWVIKKSFRQPGTDDFYLIAVTNPKNNKIKILDYYGTHPSADGAMKMAKNQKLIEKKQPKTIKVGEDAVAAKSTQYALIKDRKIIAIGEKEELLQQSQSGGRVWIVDATKKVGDLVESK